MKKVLITGAAGFIGYHLCDRLIKEGYKVIGLDNINDYYDIRLKFARLNELGISIENIHYNEYTQSEQCKNFAFIKLDIKEKHKLIEVFKRYRFNYVVNLAAQAGVRYSIENPDAYLESNIIGFYNVLECCKTYKVKHFIFASSSSVYGLNKKIPFSTHDNVDHPISLYAASKKSNELLAHTYSYLYDLPTTGLRFFTVYGPWGRPDMALFIFTKAILEGKPIDVYNHGNMKRDFTYIDDIIEGVYRIIQKSPQGNKNWDYENPDPASSKAPYKIYNIGNNNPVQLMDFIEAIEEELGKRAEKNFLSMQKGDITASWANVDDLIKAFNYKPDTPINIGIYKFIIWYKQYYMKKI